jgi:hypothetical protein
MPKFYRVYEPKPDDTCEQIEDALNALHAEGYELLSTATSAWREADTSEVRSVLVFRRAVYDVGRTKVSL